METTAASGARRLRWIRLPAGLAAALVLLAGGAPAPRPAQAAVQVAGNGFSVRLEATVAAPRARAWDTLLHVERWWNPEHTYSGDAHNLSLDARAGGCFCERLAGGGVEHLRVVNIAAPGLLRFSGALGPLQGHALAGALTVVLKPEGTGTHVSLDYEVGGYLEGGFGELAPAVDAVLAEQLARLQSAIETGKPAG